MMEHKGYVYILTTQNNTVLYTGTTSRLKKRIYEHKNKIFPTSFTSKYNVTKLIYIEKFDRIETAIAREKQIKSGSRKKKLDLINKMNPGWKDIYDELYNFE
jgi:putative endonuclease